MPDNFVQQPENTQNYNRYAYVLNNPLKYTDPSGEELISLGVACIIAVAIAATTYTLTALLSDVEFSAGGLLQTCVVSAAMACVTYGIGSAATSSFTNFYSQAAFQAAAHGTFQGVMSEVNGGTFISGFAAGALSSIAASAWSGGDSTYKVGSFSDKIHVNGLADSLGATGGFGTVAFGTIMGGCGASLSGGNFWQGAVTGLTVSLLNHVAHQIGNEDSVNTEEQQQQQDDLQQPPKKMKYNTLYFEKENNLKYNQYLKLKLNKINFDISKVSKEIKAAWNKMKCYEDMETFSRKYEQQDPGGVGRGAASALNGARCESDSVRLTIQRNQLIQQRNVLLKLIQ